ncbi:MAG: twin transmembrane helix small protein [Parvularculaceae bacterium]|nr:twin transmembrane helix small protein [Parvularculaceae bacterium]
MLTALQYFLIPIAILATTVFLGLGIYSLARGGEFAAKNSNKLMRYRVAAQAVAVALLVIFSLLLSRGGN